MERENSWEDSREKELWERGYHLLFCIGKGGFSSVYCVRDKKTQECYACKISEQSRMAEKEAALLKELEHPLFPRYISHWISENRVYLLMEYIPGSNLRKMAERRGAFSRRQVVRIGMELAEGLEFLHERSCPIIFRDMKPENVILREDGRIKLVDVGCAYQLCREVENGGGRGSQAVVKTMAGSKGYAPPEQFSLEEIPGRESDVYALGRLLQYLLAPKRNKAAEGQGKKRKMHCRRCSWKEKRLAKLLEQAVEEERKKRIPDMRSFLLQLAQCGEENKYCRAGWKRWMRRRKQGEMEFYYVQNVRKGF